ncbi:hypothetical protein ACQPYE_08140 [Actinosynnema sp. CA-299493]
MTDEQFEDLKQLIDARATATERYIDQRIAQSEQRMDAKLDTILDAIGERADAVDTIVQDHERRIVRLEKRAA